MAINVTPTSYNGYVGSTIELTASGDLPVAGCPVGETFYEGGTSEYPFLDGDISVTGTLQKTTSSEVITLGGLGLDRGNGRLQISPVSDITGNDPIKKIKFKMTIENQTQYTRQVVFYSSNADLITLQLYPPQVQSYLRIEEEGGAVQYNNDGDGDFILEGEIDYITGVCFVKLNGQLYPFSITPVSIAYAEFNINTGNGEKIFFDYLFAISNSFPNNCTGETTRVDDWTKDGQSLGITDNPLVIPNAQVSDTGDYQASANGELSNIVPVTITPPVEIVSDMLMQGDIKFFYESLDYADIQVNGDALYRDVGLENGALISLFSDGRAREDDILPDDKDNDRRGWWGDAISEQPLPSRLWLLERSAITNTTIKKAEEYVKEALQWMIDDALASEITVAVSREGAYQLNFLVKIIRKNSGSIYFKWFVNWQLQIFGGLV